MKNVHRKGKSLYFVEYLGRHKGQPRYKWHRLGPANMTAEELNGAVWRLQNRGMNTLAGVMENYVQKRLPKRAWTTQAEYERVIRTRLMPTFGHMRPDDLSQQDVAMYLEMREQEGSGPGGNREMAVLSSVFNHGMRIGACRFNPTYGVRRNEEHQRTRYVTDEELRQALRAARPALRYLLWATYLTGFRQGDMRRLTKNDLLPAGIRVRHYHDLRAKADSDHARGLGLMRRYTRARKLKAVR